MRKASLAFGTLLLALVAGCAASRTATGHEPLEIVRSAETYRSVAERDPSTRLVDLRSVLPAARFDIRYATDDNFMKRTLYPASRIFVRRPVAEALVSVNEHLERRGLGLVFFDGYRPYRVTVAMWEAIRDPDFVADPARGSRHNRGAAVDLSLYDLASGEMLDMGTGYDDFTSAAGWNASGLPDDVIANRQILLQVMERHGFVPLPSEWWHFDFAGWQRFDLTDLTFDEIDAANERAGR